MNKSLKIIIGIICGIVFFFVIDFICIFTLNRPLFAVKEDYSDSVNIIYKGLLYDTYNCIEYSVLQIKVKGTKFSCIIGKCLVSKKNKKEKIGTQKAPIFYDK